MGIAENLITIKNKLEGEICLVAVSKTKPNSDILEAYETGHRIFGENKVQDLARKYEELPKDIEWHFIGHLQTNKIKYIAPFVGLIHGVDSLKLLKAIDKEGRKNGRNIRCLLQFHIAEEETKFGLDIAEAKELLVSDEYKKLEFVDVCGVMGMATYTEDETQIRKEFKQLNLIFHQLEDEFFGDQNSFSEISMGMSGDYLIAVEEGSTMVRVGSSIFGERNYH